MPRLNTKPLNSMMNGEYSHALGALDLMLQVPANSASGTGEDLLAAIETALVTGGTYATFTQGEWDQLKQHIAKIVLTNQGTDPAHVRLPPLAAGDENLGEPLPFNQPVDIAFSGRGHRTIYYECDNVLDVTVHFDATGSPG